MDRFAIPVLLLVICGLLAGGVWFYEGAVNTAAPVGRLDAELHPWFPARAKADARPERVVVVVLDGLRLDESRTLPNLNKLRSAGVDGRANVPLPTLSRPSWTTMFSGAAPWLSGVRNNRFPGVVPVDTIFHRLRDGGLSTAGAANLDWMKGNFEETSWDLAPDGAAGAPLDTKVNVALAKRAPLTILHFVQIDEAAHRHGVGDAYRTVAGEADTSVGKVLSQLDLTKDTMIVVSDHGHLERGGHGGDEPEVTTVPVVLAGRGVTQLKGETDLGSTAGLAATLGVLLGVELPRDHHVGPWQATLNARDLGRAYVDARLRDSQKHRAEYDRRWLRETYLDWTSKDWQGDVVGNDVSAEARVAPDATPDALISARGRVFDEIARDHRLTRTVGIAMLAVLLFFLAVLGAVRGYRLLPLLGAPITAGAVTAGHLGFGLPLTRSLLSTQEGFIVLGGIEGLVGFAMMAALTVLMVRTSVPANDRIGAIKYHLMLGALACLVAAPALWMINGFAVDAPLPGPTLMFLPIWTAGVAIALSVCVAVTIAVMPPTYREASGRTAQGETP